MRLLFDEPSGHLPDQVEIDVHSAADNLARTAPVRLPRYRDGRAVWRQARDGGGEVDVAAIELERGTLPPCAVHSSGFDMGSRDRLPTCWDSTAPGTPIS
jgi:hypothetical protein